MAVDDLVKTIRIKAETSAATSQINKLQNHLTELVKTGKKYSDEYLKTEKALVSLTKWHERNLAIAKAELLIEKSKVNLAKQISNIREKRQQEKQRSARQGIDIIGGTKSFLMNPISAATKMISGAANKSFDNYIEEKQLEYNAIQEQYAANQEALSKFEGKEKLTPKEQKEKKQLEQNQKSLKTESDKLKVNIGKAAVAQAAFNTVAKAAGHLGNAFGKLTDGVKAAVLAMLDFKTGVATYNTQTSLITNREAREQQMKYGLSGSQNWAFSQAKSMLNIKSDEDLMYMNAEQRERFLSYMDRYSKWYDELESSGVLKDIQEMQLEFAELKQELSMEFLKWVAENKETIMTCIRGLFEVIKVIANIIMGIMNFITGGKTKHYDLYDSAKASDTYNSSTNNSRNTNITINANTTNNATGVLSSQDALDRYNEENWSKLAKQIVESIGG